MERIAYRPAELADAIGISRSKAYALIATGEIPSIRVGGCIRVPVEAIKQYIADNLRATA